jgi:putative transposase
MNSDQGSHFTSTKYTSLFLDKGSKISMDHCGRAFDNIFIERLWRSLKYENIYPKYDTPREVRIGVADYFKFNENRPHKSLNYRTPSQVFFDF